MSNIDFFSDPHLGAKKQAHTTTASQNMLRNHLYEVCLELLEVSKNKGNKTIIPGDLFDKFTNSEETIAQGAKVARECLMVLGGNHDQSNNKEKVSSLSLIHSLDDVEDKVDSIIISPDPAEPYVHHHLIFGEKDIDDVSICLIPHCLTQSVYAESIKLACEMADGYQSARRLLILHSNVGDAYGSIENEGTTLSLVDELQDLVVEHFDLVIVGHEHLPRTLKNGKIVVLGNIFPLTFGEIGDRYSYTFNTETGELTSTLISSAEDQYIEISVNRLIEFEGNVEVTQPFVDITGEIKPQDYPAVSRALAKLWKVNADTVFSVRNSVLINKPEKANVSNPEDTAKTLKQEVQEQVEKTSFVEQFRQIAKEIEEEDG